MGKILKSFNNNNNINNILMKKARIYGYSVYTLIKCLF